MSGVKSGRSIPLYVLILYTKVQRIPGKAAENLRFCDHVLMAIIAKSEGTFHQEHQGSHIQSNGNYNLKHSSNHLLLQSECLLVPRHCASSKSRKKS